MTIDEVLAAVKARLETIDGLTVTTDPGITVKAVPMAQVLDGQMEYHSTFGRGYDALSMSITVYVSRVDSAEGVLEARDYKSGHGTKSIRAALETAPSPDDGLEALVAVTGETGTASDAEGTSWITMQMQATAQIKGAA